MRRAALIALLFLASAPASAQNASDHATPSAPPAATTSTPAAPTPATPPAAPPATTSIPAKSPPPPPNLETLTAVEARDILGKKVSDASGEEMGLVVDVLFNENKEPRAVVIDFGGFLGVGTRKIAVDWNLLQFQPADSKTPLELALSRADIQAAPEYNESDKTVSVVNGPLPPPPAPAPTPAQPAPAQPTPPAQPKPPTAPTTPTPTAPSPPSAAPPAPH